MALIDHALLTLLEAKDYLVAQGSAGDSRLETAINAATEVIEARLGRRLVSRGNITEYHSPEVSGTTIRLSEWPTHSISSVHESTDWPRVYDPTTVLATSGDSQGYAYDAEEGMVHRISYGTPILWACGRRVIKVIHEAGYKGVTAAWLSTGTAELPDIPWDWKQLALAVTAAIYSEGERKGWGVSSQQDVTGNFVRFMGWVPPSLMDQIDAAKRIVFEKTWERAA